MADAKKDPVAAPAAAAPAPAGGSKKAMMVVLAVVGLEAATIGGMTFMSGGPKPAVATNIEADKEADASRPVELLVSKDRFPNMQTGRHFLYETEIYITVKNRDVDRIKMGLEAIKAQTQMDIATIMRSAQPAFFQEPTLSTLRRQIKSKLEERLAIAITYKISAPAAAGGEGHGGGHEAAKPEASHGETHAAPASEGAESEENKHSGVDTDKGSLVQDVLITRCIAFRAD
jgi:hypothetical protein